MTTRLPGVQFKEGESTPLREKKLRALAEQVERLAIPVLPEFPMVRGSRLQAFVFNIINTGGTLQHRFLHSIISNALDPELVNLINDPTFAFVNTPTGADASTAFSGGAKLSSAEPSRIIFDTLTEFQAIAEPASSFVLELNTSTVALTASLLHSAINVNGVTLRRPALTFRNATSGAIYDLTTLGVGLTIYVRGMLFVSESRG